MTPLRIAAAGLLLAGLAHAEPKAIKDWFVGCDNTLACMAIGAPQDMAEAIAYIRIDRAAGPDAAPIARIVVYSEGAEGPATLAVAIDGKPFGKGSFKGSSDGTYARAEFGAAESAAFIAAIANAKSMTLQRTGGTEEPLPVSLNGASASLRFIDAEQKRDGGVTALIAKGDKPASAVPAPPPAPVVVATLMTIAEGTPDVPAKDLPKADPDYCGESNLEPFVVNLSDGNLLWGVCTDAAAYNYQFAFYLVSKAGKVSALPTGSEDGDTLSVTNPYMSEDGKVLRTFAKGRGIGDCGSEEGWSWDGTTMQRVMYKSFNECRGVSSDDWIVTYRATIR